MTGISIIPLKKITVSDAMKPNSYAFSKKTSVSNARVSKNASPLEKRVMNSIASKAKNPIPKKKSINLIKSNNNKTEKS